MLRNHVFHGYFAGKENRRKCSDVTVALEIGDLERKSGT